MRSTLLALPLLIAAMAASALAGEPSEGVPEWPSTPAAAERLLFARPFSLDEPYTYRHDASRRKVSEGWVLVIEADPALLVPRDALEPVLFVGGATAQPANVGWPDGVLVVLVPSRLDMREAAVWFGEPELPERVTPQMARQALVEARAAGIAPFPVTEVAAARQAGGELLRAPDLAALGGYCHQLAKRAAPSEAARSPESGARP